LRPGDSIPNGLIQRGGQQGMDTLRIGKRDRPVDAALESELGMWRKVWKHSEPYKPPASTFGR